MNLLARWLLRSPLARTQWGRLESARSAAQGGLLSLVVLPLALGCTVAQGAGLEEELEQAQVGSAQQPILNGEVVTWDTSGVAKVSWNGNTCTGTVLSDTYVLTAAHCVSSLILRTGMPTVSVEVPGRGTVSVAAKRFVIHPLYDMFRRSPDVAVIELSSPIRAADTASFSNAIYSGTNASLEGKQLDCYGYGLNTLSSGAGVLRHAWQTVSYGGDPVNYWTIPNAQRQARYSGDSGGPCFYTLNGFRYIAGVTMGGRLNDAKTEIVENTDVGAQAFAGWVYAVMGVAVGVYENANYTGQVRGLTLGMYYSLLPTDNSVSSVTVPKGWSIDMYDGRLSGYCGGYLSNQPLLSGCDDKASSAFVYGLPALYKQPNLVTDAGMLAEGWWDLTKPGATGGIPNDSISSLSVPAGFRMTLFADAGFSGYRKTFYPGNIGFVGVGLDHAVSSIVVERF